MDEASVEKIDLSKFDESDPRQHMMKILFGCGIYFGFRGNSEHVFLEVSNFTHGEFPQRHLFYGYTFFGIDGLLDKTHHLSVHKDHVRDTKDAMRVPVMDDDPRSGDFGGSIKRFLAKLAPGQTRIYCKVIPPENRSVDMDGNSKYFYANMPIGKTGINQLFKDGAKILGLPDADKFAAHSLRAYFVTRLSSGAGVSDKERMESCRHDSVAANATYQERDCKSEANKFISLGFRPKKRIK